MTRTLFAGLTLASLLGAVISYQLGGYMAASFIDTQLFSGAGMLCAVAMFEAFSLMTLSLAHATVSTR